MIDVTKEKTLTAKDRCDSCDAQAYFKVSFKTGDLYFCNHHGRKNLEKFVALNAKILDESWALN